MKRRFLNLFLIFLLLAGLCVFCYPAAADAWNRHSQSRAITGFRESVLSLTQKDLAPMWEAALDYNRSHRENTFPGDAFSSDSEEDGGSLYSSLLDPQGTGIMGYLSIPKIGQQIPIRHGTSPAVLQTSAGHMRGTSLPVGGEGSHCVIAAHRGLPSASLFTDLDRMEVGDMLYLHILDQVLAYRVDQILPMVEKNDYAALKEAMGILPGEDHVTLFTCTPYGINSHRLLVRFVRTEYHGEDDPSEEPAADATLLPVSPDAGSSFLLLSLALLSAAGLAAMLRRSRRNRPKSA